MDQSTIIISGEEYRVVQTQTNLPAMRTWLCEGSGRRMHLRMLSGCLADDVAGTARLIREMASGSGLVVPLETGEQNGQVYILRAWVDAESFDVFAKRFKFAPKRQEHALNIGVKLCRAVEGLHHAGLVHGALKNSNVFFEKDGSPIITDPMLSEDAAKKSDPREDVRTLGLLLCRLYSGKPELAINDYTLMMLAKAKVPRQLIRVLWQAIHQEPSMRFPDAATLGRALREVPLPEYQRTVQVRALPDNVGPSDGMPAWLRNAALFVGAVGLIAVISWFLSQGEAPTVVPPKQAVAVSSTPQPSSDFWELPVPGAQPIRMRRLPAFEAMLGDDDEPNSSRRTVRVSQPFSIATTEVTRGQFAAFVAVTRYRTTAETAGEDRLRQVWVVESDRRIRPRPDYNWRQPGFAQPDDHPVTSLSWHDAKAFCDWLAQQTGQRVRLPSEAEWEYAARAGSTTKYWWGDDPADAQRRENIGDQAFKAVFPSRNTASWDDGFAHTSPVGSFETNPLGLHDMFGNVWEWTADDWNSDTTAKAFRGAGFESWPPKTAAYRYGNTATIGSNLRGFRIVVGVNLPEAKSQIREPVAAVATPPPAPESPCDSIPNGPLTTEDLTRLVPDESPGRIRVTWRTQAQQDLYGFNIFIASRREGPWSQANVQIIPGYGTRDRVTDYCFQVPNLIRGQRYWLQVQALSSTGQTDVIIPPMQVQVKTVREEREWLTIKAGK